MISNTMDEQQKAKGPGRAWPTWSRVACVIGVSAIGAVLLEACTVFGSFVHSVWEFSWWMPKRMLVFFFLLLIVNTLFARALSRQSLQERWHALLLWFQTNGTLVARSAIAFCASLAVGFAAGFALSIAMGDPGDLRYGVGLSLVLMAGALAIVLRGKIAQSLEWGFLIVGICFGTMFCLLMPTSAEISWDGHIHFNHANAISYIFDAEYTGADVLMTTGGADGSLFIMEDLASTEDFDVELGSRRVPFPHANLEDNAIARGNQILQEQESSQEVVSLLNTSTYPNGTYVSASMFGRLPNAAGLWLGRLLHLGCVGRYTLSRLCNMWFYVIVFFFAIRALKRGKSIMAVIGLCPTAMLEAANFSYDPWNMCLLALSIGLFVGRLQQGDNLTARDTIRCLVPFVLGASVRAVLFPAAIVFALVPRHKFASTKSWWLHLLATAAAVSLLLSSFAIPYFTSLSQGVVQGDTRGGSNVNGGKQIAYVLSHPIQTLHMSVVFGLKMLNPLNLGLALDPSDENLLAYSPYLIPSNAPLTEFLAAAESALLVAVSLLDGGKEDEGYSAPRYKIGTLVALALAFALICGSMYVGFTEVGRDTIAGVQQRYLLSLLPAFFVIVLNIAFRRRGGRAWIAPAFAATELVLLALVSWNSFGWML